MQSSGRYRLTIRQGPVPGKVHELAKDVMTIGRDVNNDLVINDSEVSRNHARLTSQSGGYLIEDLASTNGTFVNGQRLIGPKLLNSSDVVGLGETIVLEYSYIADSGATVVAAGPIRPMSAEPPTSPPRMPEPEPMPPPMPAPTPMMNDAMSTGSNMAPPPPPMMGAPEPVYVAPAPPPPPLPSAVPPKANNTTRNVGIGCGCLLLCACVAIAAYAFQNLEAIQRMLGV